MPYCVYCGTEDNLNTSLTIQLDDGSKAEVHICDEHAEDATISSIKQAYANMQSKINEIIEMAKKYGLTVSNDQAPNNNVIIAQPQPQPQPQPPPPQPQPQQPPPSQPQPQQPPPPQPQIEQDDPDVISALEVDRTPNIKSISGATDAGMVEPHQPIDINSIESKLPDDVRDGKVKLGVATGRCGIDIVVPQERVDGTGVTSYIIENSEDDIKLQNRFKKMAAATVSDTGLPDFAHGGYRDTMVTCTMCDGNCVIMHNKKRVPCPKCGGKGMLSIY